jgi:ABC-type dipeptide/oligopeptide/nickel transport system permease subunit
MSVKNYEHVEAARAMGASDARILLKYIYPLCISPLIIRLSLQTGLTILSESTLTFLGVGLPPAMPSWGNILSEGRVFMNSAPFVVIIPGIAIALSVLTFNLLGDSVRDILDPRLR